jgi:AAA ATPase domain/Bacterial transcriptional activator domain
MLARSGHRHLALRQYQYLRNALRLELDVQPDPRVEALHEQIRSGEFLLAESRPGPPSSSESSRSPEAPAVIGRGPELAALDEALDRAVRGNGGLIIIRGTQGIGKSWLADEVVRRADALGMKVLRGSARREQPDLPAASLVEAICGTTGEEGSFHTEDPRLNGFGPLAHAGSGVSQTVPTSDVHRGIGLAAHGPALIVIDDLHAADASTLQLLRHLSRTLQDSRLLVIGLWRSNAGESSDGHTRHELDFGTEAVHLELGCLDARGMEQLVRARLHGEADRDVYDTVMRLSEGNPYFADETIHALIGRRCVRQDQGRWRLHGPSSVDRVHLRGRGTDGAARPLVGMVPSRAGS